MKRALCAAVARAVVAGYPLAWRRRYEQEMLALLGDAPPGARALLDLLRGAALTHLRAPARLEAGLAPSERMSQTVAGVCLSFAIFTLAGAGLAKATEDSPFALAAHSHPLLGILRQAVAALALVAAGVLILGGAPLLVWVLRRAARERRGDLLRRLALAPLAVGAFVAITAVLTWWLSGHPRGGAATSASAPVFLVWVGLGAGAALACALAPRLVLARVHAPRALLALAVRASWPLGACMLIIAALTGAYAVVLAASAPALGAQPAGPLALSTTVTLALATGLMVAATAATALSAARGTRALRRSATSGPGAEG